MLERTKWPPTVSISVVSSLEFDLFTSFCSMRNAARAFEFTSHLRLEVSSEIVVAFAYIHLAGSLGTIIL